MAASRIDIHHHFFLPEYIAAMGPLANMPQVRNWTLERTHEEMDKNGVGAAVLSLSPPGIHLGVSPDSRRLARIVNDHATKLRGAQPARFGHFASVPMPDVEGTLAEIAYALDTLKADGIQLMTSYGNRWPGHPDFDPVFDELNRRKALVFIHPLEPACCAHLIDWVPAPLGEFVFDTTRCVFSLLFSGTLARCPDIRFIFCHAGGTVPMLSGRAAMTGLDRVFAQKVPNGIDHELKKLHYDVALAAYKPALAALFTYVPISQVLLGSDYPFGMTGDGIRGLAEYGLKPGDLDSIYRGNAERLIPRLKG
jgi:predicted TIM-barrel fold metal-dependent hydrolase